MARTPGGDSPELDFMESLVALALDVINASNVIKDISDDPQVLYEALKAESAGLIIQRRVIEYRPRLDKLKALASSTGKDMRPSRRRSNAHGR
jgi:hypothetical protein